MEVFLPIYGYGLDSERFLHTRGGVSSSVPVVDNLCMFSPHTWRCFCIESRCIFKKLVFSTHVEVFLKRAAGVMYGVRFLHTRGGVSASVRVCRKVGEFSPHTWRCFLSHLSQSLQNDVFSTHVEVFPLLCFPFLPALGFLHTRGGVSWRPLIGRMWFLVFSTHVEVFP